MKVIVSMSGGKDSTATVLVAIEKEVNPMLVFADTGHEHPATYEYLSYLEDALGLSIDRVKQDFTKDIERKRRFIESHWSEHGISDAKIKKALDILKPTGNPFLDLCLWKGRFPSTKARFCTEFLKVIPITEQVILPALREHKEVESWQGVRADESAARAKLPEREMDDTGVMIVRPILNWSVDQVFAMHKKHGIKPNPLYKQGMGRVGCMPCINCRKDELLEISQRFPDEIDRVAEWERLVSDASKRGGASMFTLRESEAPEGISVEEHAELAGIKNKVEWAKTSRGGNQYDLIRTEDVTPICHSMYGLCE